MSPSMRRSSPRGFDEARSRLEHADAYLVAARLAADETDSAYNAVAAGNAVLAGIAAADTICCLRLGERARGESHEEALTFLTRAAPDGLRLAQTLARLLSIKQQSHYGVDLVSARRAADATRQAGRLLARAREELERGL